MVLHSLRNTEYLQRSELVLTSFLLEGKRQIFVTDCWGPLGNPKDSLGANAFRVVYYTALVWMNLKDTPSERRLTYVYTV